MHRKSNIWLCLGAVLMLLLSACTVAEPAETGESPAASAGADGAGADGAGADGAGATAPETNLTDGCVENYSAGIDYFPQKAELTYAEGLEIEYFNNYKVVTVLNPWAGSEEIFQYVLVQCGTPAPDDYPDAQVIEVPAASVVALSSTVLPGLIDMDLLDSLVAVEEFDYINSPEVRELIDAGTIAEIGAAPGMDIELLLELDPDLVVTFAYGSPDYDAHPKLLEAGLPTVITAAYMETSPLGRAEWLKLMALFFNEEAAAEDIFADTAARYEELAATAANAEERPTVLTGINRGDAWRVSGGNSYFARFLADAGADFLWSDNDATGSVPVDFEAVYERAADADYWLPNTGTWHTLADVAAEDPRYEGFVAYENGNIYNNNGRVNEFGGNDYWETGISNPELILSDLIAIFHPDLLPDHELIFFQHVGLAEE